MAWLCDGENILKICLFVWTESTYVTDTRTRAHIQREREREREREGERQTDRQTPHDGIGRACITSRGKNWCRDVQNQKLQIICDCMRE